jgi:hypothetical protein
MNTSLRLGVKSDMTGVSSKINMRYQWFSINYLFVRDFGDTDPKIR